MKARPGGTLAMIGEAGRDEAVVPLPRHGGAAALGGGGDIYITVNGALDASAVARQVQVMLLKHKRRMGDQPLGIA